MSFSTGSGSGPQSDINVTPLVDVVLVLLIIFMVVTPLLQVGMKADIPKIPDEPPPPDVQIDPDQIVITMQAPDIIMLNSDRVTDVELATRLETMMKGRKLDKKVAYLSGTDSLYFGQVVHVMDVCKGAGVDRVGLIDPLPLASGGM